MKTALLALMTSLLGAPGLVSAQSFCSSDGEQAKAALLERFINADCADCWKDPSTARVKANEFALDWIVPSAKGDQAALSAAASVDSLARLDKLKRNVPLTSASVTTPARRSDTTLRVAHGQALSDYIGTSIEFGKARGGPWKAWLVLVETIPVGTEGSPVERHLVRNALQVDWPASRQAFTAYSESRSMRVTEGVNAERLRVVGWVEDRSGRTGPVVASVCEPQKP